LQKKNLMEDAGKRKTKWIILNFINEKLINMESLNEELKKQIDTLVDKAIADYTTENEKLTVISLKKAWELLPEPKGNYSESFNIMKYLTNIYFNKSDFKKAKKYATIFLSCQPTRNYGEQEFMMGKIAFKLTLLDEAHKHFTTADEKSGGRCWKTDGVLEYLKFYKSK
jgi:tetratricopeptide (TPR) repeat protein